MPYEIFMHDGQHCLRNQQTGKLVAGSCHADKEKTMAMMRALYANVPDARQKALEDEGTMTDSLTYYGGEVKALGNGKIGGYLVLFTPGSPDLQGDFFTKSTDFFIDNGDQRPILYRHGAHPVIKSRQLGKAQLTIDEVGVFIEGELALRDRYEQAIYKLAEKGKLGWSSGSMGHLVTRNPSGNKSFEITAWPIGEASLTPNPVEGRTAAIPLKSLVEEELDFDQIIKSFDEEATPAASSPVEFNLAGIPAVARFCEAVAPNSFKDGTQRSEAAADAVKEFIAIGNILGEAFFSDTSRLVRRSEHRFIKSRQQIDAATVKDVEARITEIEQAQAAFENVKSALVGIRNIAQLSAAEQKALDEKARFELWNFCRITGATPEELRNA